MRSLLVTVLSFSAFWCSACNSGPAVYPASSAASATTVPSTAPTIDRFQREIDAYLESDRLSPPPQYAVVFAGSSSIRGWRTLGKDFSDLEVVGRGFGGSQVIDVIRYADVLILKLRPRTVVFYCGENDIASRKVSAEDVCRLFNTFVDLVHRELPQTKIVFISLKPSPSRMQFIDEIRRANRLVKSYAETDPTLSYVDVFTPMLDDAGQPRAELFLNDRLHMTPAGYALWTRLVRPYLD